MYPGFVLYVWVAVMLFQASALTAQNLFDGPHTARYAGFLFQSGNYREAIEEYERLVFGFAAGENEKLRLVKAYRLSGEPQLAQKRLSSLWDDPPSVSGQVSFEYLALRIINNDFDNLEQATLQSHWLTDSEKSFMLVASGLFQNDYERARLLLDSVHHTHDAALQAFGHLGNEALTLSFKSPALAGLMSAIVPGSGRIYAGNWQDGLLSFVIIGVSAWQAYRGFERGGTASAYAWIYGLTGLGFYAGNIYGSIKEVNRTNHLKRDRIRIRVEAVFYNRL